MIVVVERPETTIFGGRVAGADLQEVMSYALHHYNTRSKRHLSEAAEGSGASISST